MVPWIEEMCSEKQPPRTSRKLTPSAGMAVLTLYSVQVSPAAIVENADSRASSCPTHIFSQCVCNQTQQSAFLGNTLMVDTDLTLRNGALMISANGRFHLVTSKDETIAYGQEFAVKSSVLA